MVSGWQRTIGNKIGAYRRAGGAELYVRLDGPGWRCFIDGRLIAAATSEAQARAECESTARRRDMIEAGAARVAAAAGKSRRTASTSNP